MRIHVVGGDKNLNVWFPTALVFNRLTAEIAIFCMKRYAPEQLMNLSADKLRILFAEFRRIKEKHGSWTLVDVEDADGEKVKIIL